VDTDLKTGELFTFSIIEEEPVEIS